MPELPEAETIVRGLKSTVIGKTITRAEVVNSSPVSTSRNTADQRSVSRSAETNST